MACHLGSQPTRPLKMLPIVTELDLGNYKTFKGVRRPWPAQVALTGMRGRIGPSAVDPRRALGGLAQCL